jgi:hypothetical protein
MPKANGPGRPRGRPALAEPWGPLAWAKLWTAISAQECLEGSDGEHPGRGAWEAVRALPCDLPYGRNGSRGEADIHGCCDPMEHAWRLARLRVRQADRALLPRIGQWWQAGG